MKYKQFLAGFVTCVILLSAIFITGFAEGITVLPNPYPVTINGVEIIVEAYNINGFTFLKLADVGKAIPNTTIKFNEIDKRIEINSAVSTSPASTQIFAEEGNAVSTTIEKDGYNLVVQDGKEYMLVYDFYSSFLKNHSTADKKYMYLLGSEVGTGQILYTDTKTDKHISVLNNIPTILIGNKRYIEYDYILNTITPSL